MTAAEFFAWAKRLSRISGWVFWSVTVLSIILLIAPKEATEAKIQPILITATVAGICLSVLIQHLQGRGNQAQRATQFTDSLGVPVGEEAREGYYNTKLAPSIGRLAVTTFENTFFTTAILCRMLSRERIFGAGYLAIFLLLNATRSVTVQWVLLFTQTLFSGDVALHWIKTEMFCSKVARVRDRLHQFFLQEGDATKPAGLAIALTALTDFECAKDQAAMPLSEGIFRKLNPSLSKKWNALRAQLKIDN